MTRIWVSKGKIVSMTARHLLAVLLLCSAVNLVADAGDDKPKPQKNLPLKSERSIEFDTDEGTWLSLDVSPDGKTVVFELLGDLYTLPISGGEAKPLLTGMAMETQPRYSPDGKQIAFHSNRDAKPAGAPAVRGADIYVMNADGSNVRRLTTSPGGRNTGNRAWSPDGRQIAFNSNRDGQPGDIYIYVMSADGSAMRQLTHSIKPDGHPRWSPDGRQIVFHSNGDGAKGTASEVELYLIDADGTKVRRLTTNEFYDGFADW